MHSLLHLAFQRVAVDRCRAFAAWVGRFAIAAVLLAAYPLNSHAVILIVVLGPLTLFEIEGIDFTSYATSERTTWRIENTETGHSGLVDVEGQTESQPDLKLCVFSRQTVDEKVLIEIDIGPLRGPAVDGFVELDALGTPAGREITDPALAELVSPLLFGLRLESETVDPMTGERRSVYQFESVQVPDPSGLSFAPFAGVAWVSLRRRREKCARIHR